LDEEETINAVPNGGLVTAEWLMLGAGMLTQMASGAWHLAGILFLKRVVPSAKQHPYWGVLLTFWGLLLLHASEIAFGAWAYSIALSVPGAGRIAQGYGNTSGGLLYFSGITYATLGYTQQVAKGAIRLFAMLQSLGGFMLITWSATFVYSIWDEQFRQSSGEKEDRGE